MWQRFTERARRVILLAQEEAGKLSSPHVGTEHLLLGLVRENEGVAAQVLSKAGVGLDVVRARARAESDWPQQQQQPQPKLTPEAKRVLELADDEARRLSHNYIGTEHLLVALLRERDGLAARILNGLGLDLDKARKQVLSYWQAEHGARPTIAKPRHPEVDEEKPQPPGDYASAVMLQWLLTTDSAAAQMLAECGLNLAQARDMVSRFIEEREK